MKAVIIGFSHMHVNEIAQYINDCEGFDLVGIAEAPSDIETIPALRYTPVWKFENVGFCKKGTACVYNVNNMEEIASIVACGANAISKRVFGGENRIERVANPKDVITYVTRIDDFVAKKKQLFS